MNKPVEERRRLSTVSLEELTDWTASIAPNSENDQVARAEFLRRQTSALEDTAQFTRRGALAMLVSAAVLVVSVIAAAIFTFFIRRRGGRNRARPQRGQGGQDRSRLQSPGGN
jgi:ethanolamine utilization microcompartment shell protein EutL